MDCKKCGRLLASYEEDRGLCSNCVNIENINTLKEMKEAYIINKKQHEEGIKIADKKIAFFTDLIDIVKSMATAK